MGVNFWQVAKPVPVHLMIQRRYTYGAANDPHGGDGRRPGRG